MNRLFFIVCLVFAGRAHAKTSSVFLFGPGDCTVELSRDVARQYSPVLATKIAQGQFTLDCSQFPEETLNLLRVFFDLIEKQETSTWHGMHFLMQHGASLLHLAHYLGLQDLLIKKLEWGQQAVSKLY